MEIIEENFVYYDKLLLIYQNDKLDNRKKIIKIYNLLRAFYKNLLLDEKRYFSTALAGLSFINDKFEISEILRNKLQQFYYLKKNLSDNQNLTASTDELNYAFKLCFNLIYEITKLNPSSELFDIIKLIPEIQIKKNIFDKYQEFSLRSCIVKHNPFYRLKINAQYIQLKCNNLEFGDFELKIGFPFSENANMISEGMSFHLFNGQLIYEEPLTFSARSTSMLVFEPDYLIDATDLSESYGIKDGYKIYFLKRYFSTNISYPMILGNLINTIFDEVLINPEIDFEDAKDKAFKQKPLSLFALTSKGLIKPKLLSDELYTYFIKIKKVILVDLKEIFKDAEFTVESSFISPDYGIQGRLDLLAEYPASKNRKDIIELKSGSFPNVNYSMETSEGKKVPIGVWQNHLAQVIAYNLLLETTFENRIGNSSLLYIKCDDNPLRNIANLPNVVLKMILHRNNIILLENAIRSKFFKFFDISKNINVFGLPSYISEKIQKFVKIYESLNVIEKSYLLEFSSFILRETYSGKTGVLLENGTKGFAALWNESNDEKLENNTILTGLAINYELSDFDNFHIVLDINRKELFTSFRKGDIAILFPFSEQNDKSLINNQLLKCTIKSINSDSVTISLRNKLISTNIFYNNQLWKLEPDHIDSLDKHSYSSIFNFLQCNEKKKNLIFGLAEPEFSNVTIFESDELNENQKNIVQSAVSSKDYYLIQGPPGTGKTNIVLKHIIKYLAENTEDNLLVCAYTNRAVDEISNAIKNIFPQVDYIRIGSKEATDDKKHHLPSIVDNDGLNPAYKRIKNSRIIISTIASIMTNDELFELKEFDTLIIDEASQILEPHLLGIISKVSRFIMIGDEKQLPPVVIQSKENTVCMSEPLNNIGIYNFSDSLFERLIRTCVINRWNSAFGLLEFQARMHEDIQNFAGKQFYQGKLKTIFDSQISKISGFDIQSDNAIERVLASNRMIFVDCPSDIGKVNTFQADLALKFIKSISSSFDLSMNLIGVISPFRMQCFEIYKRLSELEKNNISVDTVERFQGSQRDFIILSMSADSPKILERAVSADISGSLDRKLNVSVTRAKSHFICLGNLNVLSKSEHYLKLIEYIKQSNSIYNYYDFV